MYSDVITVATVNFRPFWGNVPRNVTRIGEYAQAAAKRGADLIVFPELALCGYENEKQVPLQDKMQFRCAELVPQGDSVTYLANIAKQSGIYLVFGMPEKDPDHDLRIYNTAVVCGPQGYIGKYRKIHPANDELAWCEKGSEPLLIDTKWGPIGVGICYDSYSFPELMRYYAAKGSRLYLNSTAMMRSMDGAFDWKSCYFDSLRYGVIANDMFIVSSNLVGNDVINEHFCNQVGNETVSNPCSFAGASVIIGPGFYEKVHVYAGGVDCNESDFFMATLDLSTGSRMIYNVNPHSRGGKADFRPDIYKKLNENLLADEFWQKNSQDN